MLLRELSQKRPLIINYYQNGYLNSFRGNVQKLNLNDQTISLRDEKENIFSIRIAWIKDVTPAV